MRAYTKKVATAVEYATLFSIVVVLGTIRASFLTWVIVGGLYIGATALARRLFGPAPNGDGASPSA